MCMDVHYCIIHNYNYNGNNKNYHILCPYFKSNTVEVLYITSLSSQKVDII